MFSTFRSCFFRRDLIFQNELASCKDKDSEDFRIQETIFSYLRTFAFLCTLGCKDCREDFGWMVRRIKDAHGFFLKKKFKMFCTIFRILK
ncbi:hypothetical protein HanXRQr2_Chr05g0222191 [Helianthus annuus]|uniref:Uncharacterized protein n=1 Tax=Helianthus annuus TaxID=4232 RepID=A0A9K3J0F2_HELAN|nr:hypothetical protein HanXRQr2_Chr05g0222191 [Helianthus annuus]